MNALTASLQVIEDGGILSSEDQTFLRDNLASIQDNWSKRQVFRTETEMRVSVLNDLKFPTPASKYWQCIREQAVFYESLVSLSFEFRRNDIEQRQKQAFLEEAEGFSKEHATLELEELRFAQLGMEQIAKDRARELRLWAILLAELDDGSFDTLDVNTHQLVSYALRFEQQAKNLGNASPAEKANIMGQLSTATRHLVNAGLLED